jgi:hypothetical protein
MMTGQTATFNVDTSGAQEPGEDKGWAWTCMSKIKGEGLGHSACHN